MMRTENPPVGTVFGELTFIAEAPPRRYGQRQRLVRMWQCSCSCGDTVELARFSVAGGHSKSCGHKNRTKGPGVSNRNTTYGIYRTSARKRGYEFALSIEEFADIAAQPCHYCGAPPSNVLQKKWRNGDYVYSGIDRVDNSIGYVLGNVVPCCGQCNRSKGTMDATSFLSWIERIHQHQEGRTS